MSSRNRLLSTAALLVLVAATAMAQDKPRFGRVATPEEIGSWDITVEPDGAGLPPGSGTAKQGAAVYAAKCLACHGEMGAGGSALRLAGVKGTIGAKTATTRTIGTFWPYATTVFDYVYTAMPFMETKSLSHDETYAVTAYLLYLNEIVGENDVIDARTLPKVKMPNHDSFVQHMKE
jgi:S-disulfanyl-L-cysteine oxidoreductase SoxD